MINVIITGGNGDIAKSIADLLNERKEFNVFCPSKEVLDVSSIESAKNYFKKIHPDILINNAGYVKPSYIQNSKIEDDIKTIDVNLKGIFICSAICLKINPNLIIINIGSSAGTKIHEDWSSYCASKAGVIMATQCWYKSGVKCYCISPGRTVSKMRYSLFPNENQNTLLDPNDLAKVVLMAIDGKVEPGVNIKVNVDNIKQILKEE